MKRSIALFSLVLSFSCQSVLAKCSKDEAKAAVEKICEAVKKDSKAALKEVQKFRYCGSNYVWIQDSDVKMVLHPIKRGLNGKPLNTKEDKKGKKLFVEFDKAAKAKKGGDWVDYFWPKPGSETPTAKTSFIKKCGGDKGWIAGSGVWKD